MTRTSHHAHATPSFPVYCIDWADDDTVLMGGGGGASRSGIENKLKACRVSADGLEVKDIAEIKLSNDEEAPMTMAVDRKGKQLVTGINSAETSIKAGNNDHCRIYSYTDDGFSLVKGRKTIDAQWSADDFPYQKLTAISPNSELLAVGTTTNSGTDGRVAVLRYPSLEDAAPIIKLENELVDIDWGGTHGEWLAVTTTMAVLLYRVTQGEEVQLDLRQTLYPPSIDAYPVIFRSGRFSHSLLSDSTPVLHAVLNVSKIKTRDAPKKSFVVNFGLVAGPSKAPHSTPEKASEKGKEKAVDPELGRWDILVRREVASKQVTVFDVSADGKLLAYGCADLSVGILDSKTLAPLLKILHAHSFPPTALRFNPSASLLVSASADQTIRAIVVPASFEGVSPTLIVLFIALLVLILAVLLRR